MVRAMLEDARVILSLLPSQPSLEVQRLWGEATATAVYVKNRLLHAAFVEGETMLVHQMRAIFSLDSSHPNVVDDMTTKDNLTYSQLKVRLHSLSSIVSNGFERNSALVDNTPIFDIEFRGSLPYVALSHSIIPPTAHHHGSLIASSIAPNNALNPPHNAASSIATPSASLKTQSIYWHACLGLPSKLSPSGICLR